MSLCLSGYSCSFLGCILQELRRVIYDLGIEITGSLYYESSNSGANHYELLIPGSQAVYLGGTKWTWG